MGTTARRPRRSSASPSTRSAFTCGTSTRSSRCTPNRRPSPRRSGTASSADPFKTTDSGSDTGHRAAYVVLRESLRSDARVGSGTEDQMFTSSTRRSKFGIDRPARGRDVLVRRSRPGYPGQWGQSAARSDRRCEKRGCSRQLSTASATRTTCRGTSSCASSTRAVSSPASGATRRLPASPLRRRQHRQSGHLPRRETGTTNLARRDRGLQPAARSAGNVRRDARSLQPPDRGHQHPAWRFQHARRCGKHADPYESSEEGLNDISNVFMDAQ